MKILKTMTTAVCILGLVSTATQAMAGKGPGQGQSSGKSSGNVATETKIPSVNLVSCEEVNSISGIVQNFVTGSGNGLEIDQGEGEIMSIYGIGSSSYWSSLAVDQPTIGESVEVEYATITFSDDSTKDVAVSIFFLESGETVELRDATTCVPLWRGSGKLK